MGLGVGRFVGRFVVGRDMACVMRVQNSMSSVSSMFLSTARALLSNLFSADTVPPKRAKIIALRLMNIVPSFIKLSYEAPRDDAANE